MTPGRDPDRPLPAVARELVADVQTLVSQEISLAKAEVGEVVGKAAKAAALFAMAGVLSLYLVGFLFSLVARILDVWLPAWAAWLIVVVLLLVVIGALAFVGQRMLPSAAPGTAAKEELDATKVVVQRRVRELRATIASAAADPDQATTEDSPSEVKADG